MIFQLPWLSLIIRRSRAEIHCPKFQRNPTSVHGIVAAGVRALPGFSPRLAFGCHPGTARQKSLPEISTRSYFGAWNCRGSRPGVARFFTATCFRLSPRWVREKNHCPKFQRGLISVHRFVAAVARALPGFSPRLAFGCRSDAVRQKIIARNFNAALFWCIDLSRQSPGRCPVYYRDLLSVVAQALPHKNSLSEISSRSRRK